MNNWSVEIALKIMQEFDAKTSEKYPTQGIKSLSELYSHQESLLFGQDEDVKPKFLWSFYEMAGGYNILRASLPVLYNDSYFAEIELSEIEAWRSNFFRFKFYIFDPRAFLAKNFLKVELEYLGKSGSREAFRIDIDSSYDFDKIAIDNPNIFSALWRVDSIMGNRILRKLKEYLEFESRASQKWYTVFYLLGTRTD